MCVFVSQLLGLLMYAPAGLDAVILRYCLYGVAKCSHTHMRNGGNLLLIQLKDMTLSVLNWTLYHIVLHCCEFDAYL